MDIQPGDLLEVLKWGELSRTNTIHWEIGAGRPSPGDRILFDVTTAEGNPDTAPYFREMGGMGGIQCMVRSVSAEGDLSVEWDYSQSDDGDFPINPDDYIWYPPYFRRLSSLLDRTGIAMGSRVVGKTKSELAATRGVEYTDGRYYHVLCPGAVAQDIGGHTGVVFGVHDIDDLNEDCTVRLAIRWDDAPWNNPLIKQPRIYPWMLLPEQQDSVSELLRQLKKGPVTLVVGG